MKAERAHSQTTSQNKKGTNNSASNVTMKSTQLMKLFEDELKDIYWAEKALTKAIPRMIKKSTSKDLVGALTNHLEETKIHITRLQDVFISVDKRAVAKKCEAMNGLIEEAKEKMDDCEVGAMCDAGIISASQKIEHYEIASYGILRQIAESLGLKKAQKLLEATLEEEKAADVKLSEIAISAINLKAGQ